MSKKPHRFERWVVHTYQFWQNYWYYLSRGHTPQKAWEMARDTL